MAETPLNDESDCEALQTFEGLEATLTAAMLDSGQYSGSAIDRLWQSWSQEFRDAVLTEVRHDTREVVVQAVNDVATLTEALVACLSVGGVKALMNTLIQKSKLEGSGTLRTRVVAVTTALAKHKKPAHSPLPPPSPSPPPLLLPTAAAKPSDNCPPAIAIVSSFPPKDHGAPAVDSHVAITLQPHVSPVTGHLVPANLTSLSPSPSGRDLPRNPPTVPPVDELFQTKGNNEDNDVESPMLDLEDDGTAGAAEGLTKQETEDEHIKFHPRGWTAEQNAKKVAEWGLEHVIDSNSWHTAAARTEWMYQSRLQGRTEDEYEELTISEFRQYATIPPVIRKEAGMVFNKTSKFDFEARVLLGLVAFEYCKMQPDEGKKYLVESLNRLENRLPDLSPAHPKRKIDEGGPEAVRRWWNDVKTWITTVAGKMRKLLEEKGNSLELLDVPQNTTKYDPADLLGRKRAGVAYNIWGATEEGVKICNPLIREALDEWAVACPESAKDGRKKGQMALGFGQKIRRDEFLKQPDEVQKQFHEAAKTADIPRTDEQRQAATEACLPHIVHIVSQAAAILGMHIAVFMSGKTLGAGVPVIVKEFTNDEVELTPFLHDSKIGGSIKADYLSFAADYHQVDPAQLQVYDRNAGEVVEKGLLEETSTGKSKTDGSAIAKPIQVAKSTRLFDPPLSAKKRGPRSDFMSKFLAEWFTRVFGTKINWAKVSRNNSQFIDLSRLPKDKNGRTFPLMNPTAMPDETFERYWDHLFQSTHGQLPAETRFLWQGEDVQFDLSTPKPSTNRSVHISIERADKTQLGKRKRGSEHRREKRHPRVAKSSRKKWELEPGSSDDDEDSTELIQEAELGALGAVPDTSRWHLRPHKSLKRADVPDEPESDTESSTSLSDEEFVPEGEDATNSANAGMCGMEVDLLAMAEGEENGLGDGNRGLDMASVGPNATVMFGDFEEVATEIVDTGVGARSKPPLWDAAPSQALCYEDTGIVPNGDDEPIAWGPQSSSAVEENPTHFEIVLDGPQSRLSNSQLESPAWLRFMASLKIWDKKMSGLGPESQDIRLSQEAAKLCAIPIPRALNSAIAIMQNWVSLQQSDPNKPETTVALNPSLHLDSITARHHIRQAVQLILDVTKPLPTSKAVEVNLSVSSAAVDTLYAHFEISLVRFLSDLTSTSEAVRYSHVELLKVLRLASFVHASVFVRDPSRQGPVSRRVEQILDRFVTVLAGVSVVRYIQAFLGNAVDEWTKKNLSEPTVSSMWLALKLLWPAAMETLSRAISARRTDLFVDRWAKSHLPYPTFSAVCCILANPAWWETKPSGVPQAFRFETKQSLFTSLLEALVIESDWSLLTLLDRSVVLLLLFACAVQLSGASQKAEDILGFTNLLESLLLKIKGSDAEIGPIGSQLFHDEISIQNVNDWIEVWSSENTIVVRTESILSDSIPSVPPSSSQPPPRTEVEVAIPNEEEPHKHPPVTSAPSLRHSHDEPAGVLPAQSATKAPSSPLAQDLGSSSAHQLNGPKFAASSPNSNDGKADNSLQHVEHGADSIAEDSWNTRGKRIRKDRISHGNFEPSVEAAVDPKQRLRQAVEKAETTGLQPQEGQHQGAARLKNPYAGNAPALTAEADAQSNERPQTKSSSSAGGTKKPRSLTDHSTNRMAPPTPTTIPTHVDPKPFELPPSSSSADTTEGPTTQPPTVTQAPLSRHNVGLSEGQVAQPPTIGQAPPPPPVGCAFPECRFKRVSKKCSTHMCPKHCNQSEARCRAHTIGVVGGSVLSTRKTQPKRAGGELDDELPAKRMRNITEKARRIRGGGN